MNRRQHLLEIIGSAREPVTGSDLAARLGVSRQVVVQDIALLRAEGLDVLATPRGYLLPQAAAPSLQRSVLAMCHQPGDTTEELFILVDHGVTVLNVMVEHPVYGELTGNLMLSSRADVSRFMERLTARRAKLLSALTGGVHLHAVQCAVPENLELAKSILAQRGFLMTA